MDIGCGPGRCLLLLAQRAQHAEQWAQQAHHEEQKQQQPGMVEFAGLHAQLVPLGGKPVRVEAPPGAVGLHGDAGALQEIGKGANFLGLDVGVGILDQANSWASERGLSHRLQYLAADALLVMQQLKAYPGRVRAVAVQVRQPNWWASSQVVRLPGLCVITVRKVCKCFRAAATSPP